MEQKLADQLTKEIWAINRTFKAFGIQAKTAPSLTAVGGDQLIIYSLRTAPGQAINEIERRLPELSEAISGTRRTKTLVRLLQHPLRLEVTHPMRKPLAWADSALDGLQPHTMLLGRTYDGGARDLTHAFAAAPHTLVAGTTGSGKSVGMLNMILSLCWATSPADLRLVLIDLKNTDLVPLKRLPHTDCLVTGAGRAAEVLGDAVAEMYRRQEKRSATPRLLVVVDEYADLTGDADCMKAVGELARKGRSSAINLLVATQHPTSKALGDSAIKNNFSMRCVGLVADASAASNAAGRPGTHAELLPGRGAFLYVTGLDCIRYQSYMIDEIVAESLITRIGRRWRNTSTTTSTILKDRVSTGVRMPVEPVVEGKVERAVEAKVEHVERDEIADIAEQIRDLVAANASKNSMCKAVFGRPYAGSYATKIDAAIARVNAAPADDKIIKLPRTGTGGD